MECPAPVPNVLAQEINMVIRNYRIVLRKNMSALATAICRVPDARNLISEKIGVTSRAVESWLQGTTQPNAENLIAMMREFDVITEEVLRLAGKRVVTDAQLRAAREALKLLGAEDDASS